MRARPYLLVLIGLLFAVACTAEDGLDGDQIDLASLPRNIDVKTTYAIRERDDVFLLDVREPHEYDQGHIPGVVLIPMKQIANRVDEIPQGKSVIVICRSGNRSDQVTRFLRENGYDRVHNIKGGILAWQKAGYPVEK
jgi:rhodanese-related sulfurtransferase